VIDEKKPRYTKFQYGFPCLASLLRPKSRGTLRIRSQDPFDYPIIDPRYLENRLDVELLIRGKGWDCKPNSNVLDFFEYAYTVIILQISGETRGRRAACER
jgi:hypothetical protein